MFVQLKDFPDYMVDENGVVVSLKNGKWRVLTRHIDCYGYLSACLFLNGKVKKHLIHRLVMQTFIEPSTLQVNHKNGIKTDNRLENLEYCTNAENIRHSHKLGLGARGERVSTAKMSDVQASQLLALKGTMTQKAAAELFGIDQTGVSSLWLRKTWKHL
jgi:hypothetical protein